jgi:hypothetical protein
MNCVTCGLTLTERGCKVRCPRCGYFEDCSDPSAPGEWSRSGATDPATVRVAEKPEESEP